MPDTILTSKVNVSDNVLCRKGDMRFAAQDSGDISLVCHNSAMNVSSVLIIGALFAAPVSGCVCCVSVSRRVMTSGEVCMGRGV